MGSVSETPIEEVDALIIGAGFSGIYQAKTLRDRGFNVKIVESGSGYGGTWYWNRYPGARTDSHAPYYQFFDPDLWQNWHFKQRFPDHHEMRAYFDFVAEKWDLRKDTYFDTHVAAAAWDEARCRWRVTARDGRVFRAQFFLPHTGIAAKRAYPAWEGLDAFRGPVIHSAQWPRAPDPDLDLRGRRVGLVGTGATGIQIAQALAPPTAAASLVVFQRTPALATPLGQVAYRAGERALPSDAAHAAAFAAVADRFFGLDFEFIAQDAGAEAAPAREARFEALWQRGNFAFWLANYRDMVFAWDANRAAYAFWRDKTRPRIRDARARDLLAPEKQPYPFGCKRVPLEDGYYEIFNRDNVHLVDLNATPVVEVTATGIRTSEREWELDAIILATGFDAVTGGLTSIDIRGVGGEGLAERWDRRRAPSTYLGIAVAGFPNMFFAYGPESPAGFCNGPTCAQMQAGWITDAATYVRDKGLGYLVAAEESERAWTKHNNEVANATLLPQSWSWYMGDNIPGKHRASLMYFGGVGTYRQKLKDCAAGGYEGFSTGKPSLPQPVVGDSDDQKKDFVTDVGSLHL
ncbi:cyclopentanone 1,2-monooxygenase [Xylariomycetidae sp. FL0641]|nr:cyclopentanone 1,2-monooxygenase [Xylariomycetidae sp. FL0641]